MSEKVATITIGGGRGTRKTTNIEAQEIRIDHPIEGGKSRASNGLSGTSNIQTDKSKTTEEHKEAELRKQYYIRKLNNVIKPDEKIMYEFDKNGYPCYDKEKKGYKATQGVKRMCVNVENEIPAPSEEDLEEIRTRLTSSQQPWRNSSGASHLAFSKKVVIADFDKSGESINVKTEERPMEQLHQSIAGIPKEHNQNQVSFRKNGATEGSVDISAQLQHPKVTRNNEISFRPPKSRSSIEVKMITDNNSNNNITIGDSSGKISKDDEQEQKHSKDESSKGDSKPLFEKESKSGSTQIKNMKLEVDSKDEQKDIINNIQSKEQNTNEEVISKADVTEIKEKDDTHVPTGKKNKRRRNERIKKSLPDDSEQAKQNDVQKGTESDKEDHKDVVINVDSEEKGDSVIQKDDETKVEKKEENGNNIEEETTKDMEKGEKSEKKEEEEKGETLTEPQGHSERYLRLKRAYKNSDVRRLLHFEAPESQTIEMGLKNDKSQRYFTPEFIFNCMRDIKFETLVDLKLYNSVDEDKKKLFLTMIGDEAKKVYSTETISSEYSQTRVMKIAKDSFEKATREVNLVLNKVSESNLLQSAEAICDIMDKLNKETPNNYEILYKQQSGILEMIYEKACLEKNCSKIYSALISIFAKDTSLVEKYNPFNALSSDTPDDVAEKILGTKLFKISWVGRVENPRPNYNHIFVRRVLETAIQAECFGTRKNKFANINEDMTQSAEEQEYKKELRIQKMFGNVLFVTGLFEKGVINDTFLLRAANSYLLLNIMQNFIYLVRDNLGKLFIYMLKSNKFPYMTRVWEYNRVRFLGKELSITNLDPNDAKNVSLSILQAGPKEYKELNKGMALELVKSFIKEIHSEANCEWENIKTKYIDDVITEKIKENYPDIEDAVCYDIIYNEYNAYIDDLLHRKAFIVSDTKGYEDNGLGPYFWRFEYLDTVYRFVNLLERKLVIKTAGIYDLAKNMEDLILKTLQYGGPFLVQRIKYFMDTSKDILRKILSNWEEKVSREKSRCTEEVEPLQPIQKPSMRPSGTGLNQLRQEKMVTIQSTPSKSSTSKTGSGKPFSFGSNTNSISNHSSGISHSNQGAESFKDARKFERNSEKSEASESRQLNNSAAIQGKYAPGRQNVNKGMSSVRGDGHKKIREDNSPHQNLKQKPSTLRREDMVDGKKAQSNSNGQELDHIPKSKNDQEQKTLENVPLKPEKSEKEISNRPQKGEDLNDSEKNNENITKSIPKSIDDPSAYSHILYDSLDSLIKNREKLEETIVEKVGLENMYQSIVSFIGMTTTKFNDIVAIISKKLGQDQGSKKSTDIKDPVQILSSIVLSMIKLINGKSDVDKIPKNTIDNFVESLKKLFNNKDTCSKELFNFALNICIGLAKEGIRSCSIGFEFITDSFKASCKQLSDLERMIDNQEDLNPLYFLGVYIGELFKKKVLTISNLRDANGYKIIEKLLSLLPSKGIDKFITFLIQKFERKGDPKYNEDIIIFFEMTSCKSFINGISKDGPIIGLTVDRFDKDDYLRILLGEVLKTGNNEKQRLMQCTRDCFKIMDETKKNAILTSLLDDIEYLNTLFQQKQPAKGYQAKVDVYKKVLTDLIFYGISDQNELHFINLKNKEANQAFQDALKSDELKKQKGISKDKQTSQRVSSSKSRGNNNFSPKSSGSSGGANGRGNTSGKNGGNNRK